MSCNSAIYCVNTTSQSYDANSQMPFGYVVRRYGGNVRLDGNALMLRGAGYYAIDVVLNTAPTGAGDITAQLYMDGVPVPGASTTVTATAGDTVALPISCMVRNCGQCCESSLTLLVDAAHTPVGLTTRVIKQ